MTRVTPLEVRFWAKVDRRGPDECWPWLAFVSSAGYGQFGVEHSSRWAHRVAYELLVGPIPDGAKLDHLCHTQDLGCNLATLCPHRRCVNPAHLEPVTVAENNVRQRKATGDRHGSRTHPERFTGSFGLYIQTKGEQNASAILTEGDVREIRRLYQAGMTSLMLGQQFGVSLSAAWRAATGRTWSHIK